MLSPQAFHAAQAQFLVYRQGLSWPLFVAEPEWVFGSEHDPNDRRAYPVGHLHWLHVALDPLNHYFEDVTGRDLIERDIARGLLTHDEHQAYLAGALGEGLCADTREDGRVCATCVRTLRESPARLLGFYVQLLARFAQDHACALAWLRGVGLTDVELGVREPSVAASIFERAPSEAVALAQARGYTLDDDTMGAAGTRIGCWPLLALGLGIAYPDRTGAPQNTYYLDVLTRLGLTRGRQGTHRIEALWRSGVGIVGAPEEPYSPAESWLLGARALVTASGHSPADLPSPENVPLSDLAPYSDPAPTSAPITALERYAVGDLVTTNASHYWESLIPGNTPARVIEVSDTLEREYLANPMENPPNITPYRVMDLNDIRSAWLHPSMFSRTPVVASEPESMPEATGYDQRVMERDAIAALTDGQRREIAEAWLAEHVRRRSYDLRNDRPGIVDSGLVVEGRSLYLAMLDEDAPATESYTEGCTTVGWEDGYVVANGMQISQPDQSQLRALALRLLGWGVLGIPQDEQEYEVTWSTTVTGTYSVMASSYDDAREQFEGCVGRDEVVEAVRYNWEGDIEIEDVNEA